MQQEVSSIVPEIEFLPVTKPKFTHSQIHDALMFTQELMERSSFYDFVLLGDIAKAIVSTDLPKFDADKIECGITHNQYTESGKSMFYTVCMGYKIYPREHEDRLELEYKGIPVIIRLLDNEYPFVKRPDSRFYTISEFKIPNPFKEYVKAL